MSLIKQILEDLATPIKESGLSVGDIVYHPYKILYGDLKKLYKGGTVQRSLKRAEKSGLLQKRKIDEKTYLTLTELGEKKLIQLRKELKISIEAKDEEWDGKYRIVLFDIPENNRAVRDLLRAKLKELEFIGWQKSVWISKKRVTKELRDFFKEAGLGDYTLVIETQDLGDNKLEYLMTLK